jgi:hypothetical protein
MSIDPGWYVDPEDPAGERERYWDGNDFRPGARTVGPKTGPFPAPAAPPTPRRPISNSGLNAARTWMILLATLTVIGAAIGAFTLGSHKGQSCTTNPYDVSLQTCTTTHPFLAAAIAIAAAGLLQAVLFGVVALLCRHVAELRTFAHQYSD